MQPHLWSKQANSPALLFMLLFSLASTGGSGRHWEVREDAQQCRPHHGFSSFDILLALEPNNIHGTSTASLFYSLLSSSKPQQVTNPRQITNALRALREPSISDSSSSNLPNLQLSQCYGEMHDVVSCTRQYHFPHNFNYLLISYLFLQPEDNQQLMTNAAWAAFSVRY